MHAEREINGLVPHDPFFANHHMQRMKSDGHVSASASTLLVIVPINSGETGTC
jgi:hypothetical protein